VSAISENPINPGMPIKVAIVEDKRGVRENWANLVESAPGFRCVAACETGEAALATLIKCRPDVVLMDIHLPGISGIECTLRLKQLLPETQVLIVTVCSDADRVFEALKAGASGYLLKSTAPAEFLSAIADVTQGRAPMTGEIARLVIESFRQPAPPTPESVGLTEREEECLRLLARGNSNKEIAQKMGISASTVHFHLKSIYNKLHVRSRTEATLRYLGSAPAQPPGRP
jgi:DNA-binding NarL/FixJ family response regulator